MDIRITCTNGISHESLSISGSKSETNRLLILQSLFPGIALENISNADDSKIMQAALESSSDIIDVGHAGTAMRFLTAYFAICEGRSVALIGSPRMQARPIGGLVKALKNLGADIVYKGAAGFPPLFIKGKKLSGGKVLIDGKISSQYITAVLLIAARLEKGISITLQDGSLISRPYVDMTLKILQEIGISTSFNDGTITVKPCKLSAIEPVVIESDWSSACYFYAIVALSPVNTALTLSTFYPDSRQGDSRMAHWFVKMGIETSFSNGQIIIRKSTDDILRQPDDWFGDMPDCIPTIFVMCFGLGLGCRITGAQTLRLKETDRISALHAELSKLGAVVSVTKDSLTLEPSTGIRSGVSIATYDDHRMAMSFAALALKVPIIIEDAKVVSKSYPAFWEDLEKIGFQIGQA